MDEQSRRTKDKKHKKSKTSKRKKHKKSKKEKKKKHRSRGSRQKGLSDERSKMKNLERQLMMEALHSGYILRPENSTLQIEGEDYEKELNVDEAEMKHVIANTQIDVDREKEYGDRVQGLGLGKNMKHEFVDISIRRNPLKVKRETTD